jgi:hypothetical protein
LARVLVQKNICFYIVIGYQKITMYETKIQPEITAGINYHFNEHFALTAEYLHSFGNNIESFVSEKLKCPSINAVLIGIRVAFW